MHSSWSVVKSLYKVGNHSSKSGKPKNIRSIAAMNKSHVRVAHGVPRNPRKLNTITQWGHTSLVCSCFECQAYNVFWNSGKASIRVFLWVWMIRCLFRVYLTMEEDVNCSVQNEAERTNASIGDALSKCLITSQMKSR